MREVEIVPDAENCFSVAIGGDSDQPVWQVMVPEEAIEDLDLDPEQFSEVLRHSMVYYPDYEIGLPLLNALAMVPRSALRQWIGQGVDDDVRKRALGEG
jgi:hypothetical protein